jgi:hypothetical protein
MKLASGYSILAIPDFSALPADKKDMWLKWIQALRSGNYAQIHSRLRTSEGFCCLGVICNLVVADNLASWEEMNDPPGRFQLKHSDGDSNTWELPNAVSQSYGLTHSAGFSVQLNPRLEGSVEPIYQTLAQLNDNYSATFEEIATILETALAGGLNTASL